MNAVSTASPSSRPEILRGEGLPLFEAVTPEAVREHIPELIEELERELGALESSLEQSLAGQQALSWESVMDPLQRLGERLRWSWGVVSHLNGVCNSPELREAHAAQQAAVVQFGNRAGQSQVIFAALQHLNQQRESLDGAQQRILAAELRDMQLRGVGLSGAAKEAFNSASQELAELSTRFGNQVLDATNRWTLRLSEQEDIVGLPISLLEQLAQAAREAGETGATAEQGPWLMGLDMPRYAPFMQYSQRRDLRQQVYTAHISRASGHEGDALNNWPLIEDILRLRSEQAQRLGYANWAEVSIAAKMADSEQAVETLLEELREAAYPIAQQELTALAKCARRHGAEEADQLKPWDISFWAECLRKESFELDSEALRPWFPLPQVLDGLFALSERLFGITIEAADGEAPVWHPDVRFFRIKDQGEAIAAFYLDPYSRPGSKRGGAWMDECLVRSRKADGTPVLPVAYLICNQSPPVAGTPSLMRFEEVETLFHEFGHGLQHMLTSVERPQAAGINGVEWDAVELPSQFMENWCYDRATLMGMARHWQNGSPLPESEYAKLLAARTFMGGSATLRQVHFALVDLKLHSQWQAGSGVSPEQLRRQIAANTTVLAPIDEDAFLCSFGHIFAGGYAAGYYSYKWAEVLSADAFGAFEEVGLENEAAIQETGRRFRNTVLSLGGSLDPKEVFEAFRGRQPRSEALIRHSGLVAV
ncbi:MAG: M3 family metallopeptidase [Vulcanococcus sp.]